MGGFLYCRRNIIDSGSCRCFWGSCKMIVLIFVDGIAQALFLELGKKFLLEE